ncbi:MAG: carbonic anhydrase [Candidatus Gastranaerophilales bacterium]|nr:carbonic anhydrase [Candidatus Gastranaerophilales bacterium]
MNQEAQNELERLLNGNKRFITGTPKAENKCLQTLQKLSTSQSPKAIVLSCSDSRIVPELIFDCGIGELFVVRTAGVGIGPNITESIEFGIEELKIPLLILLGHDNCGVIKYAKDKYPAPLDDFYGLMNSVYPVLGDNKLSYNEISQAHTILTKKILMKRSYIIREAVEKNKLAITTAHFSFESGTVEII